VEAASAVAAVLGLQVGLAVASYFAGWRVWDFRWWVWLVAVPFELLLWFVLVASRPRQRLEEIGKRREATLILLVGVGAATAFLLFAMLASLISGTETSGAQLLLKAVTVWATNVVAFGLWYWVLDRGGPVRRIEPNPPPPDFQFPQMQGPGPDAEQWRAHFLDYVYVAYTNAIAFSPTDTMPLTRRAKLAMMFESAISAVTLLLVAARAVNIFKGGG
jgi:MFS family permease